MPRRALLATLALFVALAVLHTWPLASAPARYWRDTPDYKLNMWALAWVAHEAPLRPTAFFHANIFHPERWTLAFSEHLLPQGIFAAPVIWLGGSPVLAYNVTLLAGFSLTGWAMTLLIARWTGSLYAGVLAGCLATFNAASLTNLAHVQSLHVMYLPLALLALDRLLSAPGWRPAVAAGACLALQAMTSSYWVVFTAIAATAGILVRAPEWWPARAGATVARMRSLALAAATAVVLMAPVLYPYWQVREAHEFSRPIREAARYSATARDYLRGSSRVHLALAERLGQPSGRAGAWLFPGFVATALAGVAVVTLVFWRDRRARMLTAAGVTGLVLSFGPSTLLYQWLHAAGLLENMRASSRFGVLMLIAVAGLAGFGMARVLASRALVRSPRRTAWVALAAIALVTLEALRAPIVWDEFAGVSRVYQVLRAIPDAVIVEIPFSSPGRRVRNAVYLPAAAVHRRPMVNGYSGFLPASYIRLWNAGMDRFPEPTSVAALRAAGVTHAVVHASRLGRHPDRAVARIESTGAFELLVSDGDVRLYRVLAQ